MRERVVKERIAKATREEIWRGNKENDTKSVKIMKEEKKEKGLYKREDSVKERIEKTTREERK